MKHKTLNQLRKLAIESSDEEGHPFYAVKDNDPYMPFWFERIGFSGVSELWSMAHWGKQNGDVMRDPDIELAYDRTTDEWTPVSFRNDYVGVLNDDLGPAMIADLEEFLRNTWLPNLVEQGFLK